MGKGGGAGGDVQNTAANVAADVRKIKYEELAKHRVSDDACKLFAPF